MLTGGRDGISIGQSSDSREACSDFRQEKIQQNLQLLKSVLCQLHKKESFIVIITILIIIIIIIIISSVMDLEVSKDVTTAAA